MRSKRLRGTQTQLSDRQRLWVWALLGFALGLSPKLVLEAIEFFDASPPTCAECADEPAHAEAQSSQRNR